MRDISDFKILNLKGDCFDTIIASFAQWLKGEYRFLFIDCLGFDILETGETLGERIYVDKGDIIVAANNNGITTKFYLPYDLNLNRIRCLLNEFTPLILELDEYDCYWRKNYLKIHRRHFVLIVDYVMTTADFRCIDTFPNDSNLMLSDKFVTEKLKRIICISDNKQLPIKYNLNEAITPANIKLSIDVEEISIWERYYFMIDDLIISCSLEKEIKGFENVDIIFVPLIWNLKNVLFSFYQYQYFLEYLDIESAKPILCQLDLIKRSWEIAISILAISIIRKNYCFPKDKVQDYFRKAIDEMKKFNTQLSSLLAI